MAKEYLVVTVVGPDRRGIALDLALRRRGAIPGSSATQRAYRSARGAADAGRPGDHSLPGLRRLYHYSRREASG